MNPIRINKYLADAGVASRRKCDELIRSGKVCINQKIAKNGDKVDTLTDVVSVNGAVITRPEKNIYLILNKPMGYLTTNLDEFGRKTIMHLLPPEIIAKRVYAVGRLDYDSHGLLLLTNDGELTHKLLHPKKHVEKEYEVLIERGITDKQLEELRSGVDIGDYTTGPAIVEKIALTKLKFILTEGKHRQIRRMCSKVGLDVLDLKRVRIASISLGDLKDGEYRLLKTQEVDSLNLK